MNDSENKSSIEDLKHEMEDPLEARFNLKQRNLVEGISKDVLHMLNELKYGYLDEVPLELLEKLRGTVEITAHELYCYIKHKYSKSS